MVKSHEILNRGTVAETAIRIMCVLFEDEPLGIFC